MEAAGRRDSSTPETKKTEPIPPTSQDGNTTLSPRKNEEMVRPLGHNNVPLHENTTTPTKGVEASSASLTKSMSDQQLAQDLTALAPASVKMHRGGGSGSPNKTIIDHHDDGHSKHMGDDHHKHHHHHPHDDNSSEQQQHADSPSPMEELSVGDLFAIFQKSCKESNVKPWPPLVSLFQRCSLEGTNITFIDMSGVSLKEHGSWFPLVKVIIHNPHLLQLWLPRTHLDDEGVTQICAALLTQKNVQHLNLASNDLHKHSVKPLAEVMRKTALVYLDLSGNKFTGTKGVKLCTSLGTACQIRAIMLNQTGLTDKAIIALTRALKSNKSILDLRLGENKLTPRDAFLISHMLQINTTLRILDIRHNNIEDQGLEKIAEVLAKYNKTLRTLVVWDNHITDKGVMSMAAALEVNTTLTHLDLGSNSLTLEGINALKDSLGKNKGLSNLGLAATDIGSEEAVCLAEALSNNNTLKSIDLRKNTLGIAGLMALSLAMKINQSVESLVHDTDEAEGSLEHKLHVDITEYCQRNKAANEASAANAAAQPTHQQPRDGEGEKEKEPPPQSQQT